MHYLTPIIAWMLIPSVTIFTDIVTMTPLRRKVSLKITKSSAPMLAVTFILAVSMSILLYFYK